MAEFTRFPQNPILTADKNESWQAAAAFNPSVVKHNGKYYMLYRALSAPQIHEGVEMQLSTIGLAESDNGIDFNNRRQIIKPEFEWEKFGCEDPRITFCEGKFYIFYTALSVYPFTAKGIHIGVAVTTDLIHFEKHRVTNFNSKAMALFPEKINGKYAAVLTVHTDLPPAMIAIAMFNFEEEIWQENYWNNWYANLYEHVIPLLRSAADQVEIGAQPVKTEKGWLLIHSYINNYFTDNKHFGIEAVLLHISYPLKMLGQSTGSLMQPEKDYELHGDVPGIIFPSGALAENEKLTIYYGAADTSCCAATGDTSKLLEEILQPAPAIFEESKWMRQSFKRYSLNPIIAPRPEFYWEAKATFNAAVMYENNCFHFVYRAMSMDDTSVFGYASSKDGIHIDERLPMPIYEPRATFEKKLRQGNSGCEDPRITKIEDELYMFYTAYDGYTPRVAITTIKVNDFLEKRWNWTSPRVITPPNLPDKDACLLSKKINGKYVIFHRMYDCICINMEETLDFNEHNWLEHRASLIKPRKTYWDNSKFGISAPPIETEYGWLLIYHRATIPGSVYKVEAALLDLNDPATIIAQTDATLLEPEMEYEQIGIVPNVVFPCGAVLLDGTVYLYYGAADKVLALATMELKSILLRFGICT